MPRVVVYGPTELGGISYPSLETIQDQKGISLFLRQLQCDKDVAIDLRILLSRAQLDSGLMHPIMDATKIKVPYLEEGLISHLRDRLGHMGASIVISETWYPALQQCGDIAIMEALLCLPDVKKPILSRPISVENGFE